MQNNYIGKEYQQTEEKVLTEESDFLNQLLDSVKLDLEEISKIIILLFQVRLKF
jgi:hypothetical protein